METKDNKTDKESKSLKNKENSNNSGSEESNQNKAKKKEGHKNENKAWLSQRISELGEDKILYTSNSSGRHPRAAECGAHCRLQQCLHRCHDPWHLPQARPRYR